MSFETDFSILYIIPIEFLWNVKLVDSEAGPQWY